jgi:hypothetical protein
MIKVTLVCDNCGALIADGVSANEVREGADDSSFWGGLPDRSSACRRRPRGSPPQMADQARRPKPARSRDGFAHGFWIGALVLRRRRDWTPPKRRENSIRRG